MRPNGVSNLTVAAKRRGYLTSKRRRHLSVHGDCVLRLSNPGSFDTMMEMNTPAGFMDSRRYRA